MASCEKNILEIPLTASAPDADDVIIFMLPDGTSVLRSWSTISAGLVPNDKEIVITATGGDINNGDTSKVFADLMGRRIRFFRNKQKESLASIGGGSSYSWNSGTGTLSFSPAASTDELFQVEAY